MSSLNIGGNNVKSITVNGEEVLSYNLDGEEFRKKYSLHTYGEDFYELYSENFWHRDEIFLSSPSSDHMTTIFLPSFDDIVIAAERRYVEVSGDTELIDELNVYKLRGNEFIKKIVPGGVSYDPSDDIDYNPFILATSYDEDMAIIRWGAGGPHFYRAYEILDTKTLEIKAYNNDQDESDRFGSFMFGLNGNDYYWWIKNTSQDYYVRKMRIPELTQSTSRDINIESNSSHKLNYAEVISDNSGDDYIFFYYRDELVGSDDHSVGVYNLETGNLVWEERGSDNTQNYSEYRILNQKDRMNGIGIGYYEVNDKVYIRKMDLINKTLLWETEVSAAYGYYNIKQGFAKNVVTAIPHDFSAYVPIYFIDKNNGNILYEMTSPYKQPKMFFSQYGRYFLLGPDKHDEEQFTNLYTVKESNSEGFFEKDDSFSWE